MNNKQERREEEYSVKAGHTQKKLDTKPIILSKAHNSQLEEPALHSVLVPRNLDKAIVLSIFKNVSRHTCHEKQLSDEKTIKFPSNIIFDKT